MKFDHVCGSIVAMITPFHADGSVNFEALTTLIERQIAGGTDAILTLGTTGEYSTMTHEEDAAVVRHTIDTVAGRVPVIVGSGSNCTATQIEMSRRYEAMGADALLIIAPYYNKANAEGMYRHFADTADAVNCTATQIEMSRRYEAMGADALLIIAPYYNKANAEGMYRHFADTADAVNVPCILYNVPGRTGCSIPVSVVERLAQHPNICGIKEASGNMSYAMEVARFVGPDFQMWSGNDDITLPIMAVGGSGVISVYANVDPASCHKMCADWLAGRHDDARREQLSRLNLMNRLFIEVNCHKMCADWLAGRHDDARREQLSRLNLMNRLFIEVNPIPVKTALNMMGLNAGPMRLPLCDMAPENAARLRAELVMNRLFIEVNPIPVKTALNMMGLNAGPMRLPLCDMAPENAARLRAELVTAGLITE